MLGVVGFLDSREKATVLWSVVLLGYVWRKDRTIAPLLLQVLRSMFVPTLSLVWGIATAYAAVIVLAADEAGLWDPTAIKATLYWFVGTAVVLTGNALTTRSFDRKYAKRVLRKAVGFTILAEFLLTFYVMPLAVELAFVPLVGSLVSMQLVAERDPKLTNVKTLVGQTLMLVGSGLMIWVLIRAATDLHSLLTRANAERLLLPPAFTLAFVPVLYGMWRWSEWDRERIMRQWCKENLPAQPRLKAVHADRRKGWATTDIARGGAS